MENVKFWIDEKDVEESAMEQIRAAVTHPRLFKHLAIMPDVHKGMASTIGSVLALRNAIIPAAVGVDIGCGVCAVETDIHLDDISKYYEQLHAGITTRIPTGYSHRGSQHMNDTNTYVDQKAGFRELCTHMKTLYPDREILPQLGTLGGGNHFVELQYDPKGKIWAMIHSGSRNIGNKIAINYIRKAKGIQRDIIEDIPKDMDYLDADSDDGKMYLFEMSFALNFAFKNREMMMWIVQEELNKLCPGVSFKKMINIHHNYVSKEIHFDEEVWVHRKGATNAELGRHGLIPGSMGSPSFVVRGLGNSDSFNSCSHGAGRRMSRNAAAGKLNRRTGVRGQAILSMDDFAYIMKPVYTHDIDIDHLDEAPGAYKEIDEVMENQKNLIEIETKLIPVFNMKG